MNTSDGEEHSKSAEEDGGEDDDEVEEDDDEDFYEEEEDDDSDDGQGWITPGNISQMKADSGDFGANSEEDKVQVACLTTDFAMQV